MNANFLALYEMLVRDINMILEKDSSDKEKMESCFRLGIEHWNKLKSKIKSEGFESDKEEIHFFKDIKPRFTGEIEYYTQRYHAILFLPETDTKSQVNFWEGELGRINKFFGSYHEFFKYYNSKKTEHDERYFLRRNSDGSNIAHANVFDLDNESATSHDWLLTNMIGYEKYKKYVLTEIEQTK
ncbi:MAG TPA: RteC domain-containing protein [Puia sp.]